MKLRLSNTYIKFKIIFGIPLPIRNHIYKGRWISLRKKWFCKSCRGSFDLLPWKAYKRQKMSEFVCPHCGSGSVHWSIDLFKAQVDRKPSMALIEIANNPENCG